MASTSSSTRPATAGDPAEQLYHTAQHYIGQVIQLLEKTVTQDAHLQHTSTRNAGSTIGKHLRHLHDHYRLLLEGIPSTNSEPLDVNYDVRSRNGDAENHHDACVKTFRDLSERLRQDTGAGKAIPSDRKVRLTAITPEKVVVESTFGRELWFASFHAVHHFALIKVLIDELNLEVADDFGVAPSTLVHRHELMPNKL
ncbi:uncharacterized protein JCM15063_005577 [Sporobolomyces koalae]|uniref:uncharacterized protein n=1 Tax=Sporobolomyces koalae TaxID=500713 RepID=UPI003173705B